MAYSDEDLIKAALIEDDEDKALAAETGAKDDDSKDSAKSPDETKSEEAAKPDTNATDNEDDDEAEGDGKDLEVKDDKKSDTKEDEADKPEAKNEDLSTDEQRQTRKEKREERKQAFMDRIKREQARETQPIESKPHNPLDYNQAEQFDVKDLEADRKATADNAFSEGAKLERAVAQQEKFWDSVTYETKLLEADPKYAFLKEGSDTFDEDRAGTINELYLEMVGYREVPQRNAQGQILLDPQTRQPLVTATVGRTDLSYEKFVKNFVETMENWSDEQVADTSKNLAQQARNTGIRPGGNARSGLRKLRPGDISKMSDEDFEKYESEIDNQILSSLE